MISGGTDVPVHADGHARFRFVTTWTLRTAPQDAWDVVSDVGSWAHWWPGISSSEVVRPGDESGVGLRTALAVRSPLGYTLRFGVEVTEARRPHAVRARVVGDLRGSGRIEATPASATTLLTITWEVASRRRAIRLLRPLAPWAHGFVMDAGERRLDDLLAG